MKWATKTLEDVANVQRGRFSARPRNDPRYYGGDIPFIQTGDVAASNGRVQRFSQTLNTAGLGVSKLFPKGSLVMTIAANIGDIAEVEFDFACPDSLVVITAKDGIDRDWLRFSIEAKKRDLEALAPENAQKNLNLEVLKPLPLEVPPAGVQRKIAESLHTWESALHAIESLLAGKERFHRWLQQRLIDQRAARHHWETRELGGLIRERTERSIQHDEYPVLTSSRRGLFLQSEYFSKQVTSEDNTGYKIMRRGDFTFRSMSDDGRFVFNRLEKYDAGIISPAYGVFYADGVSPEFLVHYLNSAYFAQLLARETQGGTRKALRFSALAGMEVDLPKRTDQERIASTLDESRREIGLLQAQLEMLRRQKRGLMQKLLTGEWRVPVAEVEVA
ncbi:restriction endonuclease subunit S [Burkholderia multivorans]|uniref:restriction endonuclease subunit S n=1 Tax=Burkholderia multivorans TaxID=87883 RepID=UPI001C233049|nr:restriction endonuclease subunit S [Burkholderia multivorans]MBU9585873.1 restriction endonuclease subunit S [Burkholderia multivorans]